jgi:hypothetical protein
MDSNAVAMNMSQTDPNAGANRRIRMIYRLYILCCPEHLRHGGSLAGRSGSSADPGHLLKTADNSLFAIEIDSTKPAAAQKVRQLLRIACQSPRVCPSETIVFRGDSANCPCSECFSIGNWAIIMQFAVAAAVAPGVRPRGAHPIFISRLPA